MKKLVALLFVICGAAVLYAQTAPRGIIREVNGTVEVKAPGATAWTAAAPGMELEQATAISTGIRSTALIGLGNSVLVVRPLTRLTLEEIQMTAGNEEINLRLQTGRVRANVTPPTGGRTQFSVRSPSATASVRGTAFEFDGYRLKVDEGRVHVTGGDYTGMYVGAGHTIAVNEESGKTASPAETTREELAPALPAGVSVPDVPASTPAVVPLADVQVGLEWN
ncbi:iron dicitrate transporter FecR [Spirochaetia bacterium]|nr:iron dicitrate transporter FecR [Spirochaetia bacterium]